MSVRTTESVWQYPRPPAMERTSRHVRAVVGGHVVAETTGSIRVLETSHPPVYYIPPDDVATRYLQPSPHTTFCEYKGEARYYSLVIDGETRSNVAWYYPDPSAGYEELAGYIAFYAWALDEATVDGEQVTPQPGRFYGGWITGEIVGPFKGETSPQQVPTTGEKGRVMDDAQKVAAEAQELADAAQKAADEAQELADKAQERADEAQERADEAQERADEAQERLDEEE